MVVRRCSEGRPIGVATIGGADAYLGLMAAPRKTKPRCIIIAGPNGAGKTTFAKKFLTPDKGILHFVNADLIASGLSPLHPGVGGSCGGPVAAFRTGPADERGNIIRAGKYLERTHVRGADPTHERAGLYRGNALSPLGKPRTGDQACGTPGEAGRPSCATGRCAAALCAWMA